MNFGQAAFGLRQVKLTALDGSGIITLPSALMLHVTPRWATAQFEAEGIAIASRGVMSHAEWEMESGGIPLDVYNKMTGLTLANTGSTPNRVATLTANWEVELPYFRIYGKAADESTGDIHVKLFKCKLAALEGTFRDGEFWVTSCAGIGLYKFPEGVFTMVQHETAATLS